jgi:Rrf2 family nitric oxide-sensitive transcriptional repressor
MGPLTQLSEGAGWGGLMKLSLFSDYSLRVLMYGALKGETFQLDEVTKAYGISRHHLAKVVQRLAQLGYLETRRGRNGGITLARTPQEIRIGRLVRETEEQPAILECFDPATNTCPINGSCQLKGIVGQALREFYAVLDRHTLHDTINGPHRARIMKTLLG